MSIVQKLLSGDTTAINEALYSRGAYVVTSLKTQGLVGTTRLQEMRDAPDQSHPAMSRREVEKLLASYERRDDDNMDAMDVRSPEGMRRARWYAPEVKSDFDIDFKDIARNTAPNTNSDDDEEHEDQDWSGEYNPYFNESEHEGDSTSNLESMFHDSVEKKYPVQLHLDDGSYVHMEPHHVQHMVESNLVPTLIKSMESSDKFNDFLKTSAYPNGDK